MPSFLSTGICMILQVCRCLLAVSDIVQRSKVPHEDDDEIFEIFESLFQEPTNLEQLIYYLEQWQDGRSRWAFFQIFRLGVIGKMVSIVLVIFLLVEVFFTKLLQLAISAKLLLAVQIQRLKYFCMSVPSLILGEGYIMRQLFHYEDQDKGLKVQHTNSCAPLNFPHACAICMEPKQDSYMASLNSCSHKFCKRCLFKYIETCIQDHRYPIPCPQCAEPLSVRNIRRIINTAVEPIKYLQLLKKYDGDYKVTRQQAFYCPNPHCESSIRIDQNSNNSKNNNSNNDVISNSRTSSLWKSIQNIQLRGSDVIHVTTKGSCSKQLQARCPGCQTLVCKVCRSVQHDGLTCDEFQLLKTNSNLDTDMTLLYQSAERLGFGQCPHCKQLVEKSEGCDHISCYCGKDFNIDRQAIKHGQYYQRPMWMYGKSLNETNQQGEVQDEQVTNDTNEADQRWMQVDFFEKLVGSYFQQSVEELAPSEDRDAEEVRAGILQFDFDQIDIDQSAYLLS